MDNHRTHQAKRCEKPVILPPELSQVSHKRDTVGQLKHAHSMQHLPTKFAVHHRCLTYHACDWNASARQSPFTSSTNGCMIRFRQTVHEDIVPEESLTAAVIWGDDG